MFIKLTDAGLSRVCDVLDFFYSGNWRPSDVRITDTEIHVGATAFSRTTGKGIEHTPVPNASDGDLYSALTREFEIPIESINEIIAETTVARKSILQMAAEAVSDE